MPAIMAKLKPKPWHDPSVLQSLVDQGLSKEEIAEELGTNRAVIAGALAANQIVPTPKLVDPLRFISDDEVIKWWEDYDAGDSIEYIAWTYDRHIEDILKALDELGAFELPRHPRVKTGRAPTLVSTDKIELDQNIIERVLSGSATESEKSILRAFARLQGALPGEGLPARHLPFIRVLPHQKPMHRSYPQSARERGQNRLATGVERKLVSNEMARAGLMGTARRGSGLIGYWT